MGLQGLIEGLRGCKDQDDLYNYIKNLNLKNGDSRLLQKVGSYAGFCNSKRWTFCVHGSMNGVLPDGFTNVRRDAMVQWIQWWTNRGESASDSIWKTT